MNRARQHIAATTAMLIYASEPLWSALTGHVIRDRLMWNGLSR